MPQLSDIVLATYIQQDIDVAVKQHILTEENIPAGFNVAIQSNKGKIYGFLPPGGRITNDGLTAILGVFQNYSHINFVYTDTMVGGQINYGLSFPTVQNPILMNTPVFIKQFPALFNEQLQMLYFYQMRLLLEQSGLGLHLAEPILTLAQQPYNKNIYENDLRIIHGQSSST
jgi:hypothetical protein